MEILVALFIFSVVGMIGAQLLGRPWTLTRCWKTEVVV